MKLLSLFLAVLTITYLLPFSVFAEKTADDAVIRGKIERFERYDISEGLGAFALAMEAAYTLFTPMVIWIPELIIDEKNKSSD